MEQRFEKKVKIHPIPDEDWNFRAYWGVSFRYLWKVAPSEKLRTQALSNSKLNYYCDAKKNFEDTVPISTGLSGCTWCLGDVMPTKIPLGRESRMKGFDFWKYGFLYLGPKNACDARIESHWYTFSLPLPHEPRRGTLQAFWAGGRWRSWQNTQVVER